jgi:hypothetical protein
MEDPELPTLDYSLDTVKTELVSAIDVGLVKDLGVSMDLVENGLTKKVLEIKLDNDIGTADLGFILAESDFDADVDGILTKKEITKVQVPVYETSCTTEKITDKNGTTSDLESCESNIVSYKEEEVINWAVVSLKSEESTKEESIKVYSILEKGIYRYEFNIPIVKTANGWGSSGVIYAKLGEDIYVDKQHSSWWNNDYEFRECFNIQPTITDDNQQLELVTTAIINRTNFAVVLNSSNTEIKGTTINNSDFNNIVWINASVTGGDDFGICVYLNRTDGAINPIYNVTDVFLESYRFETQTEINNFGDKSDTGTFVINNTEVYEGIGSMSGNYSTISLKQEILNNEYANASIVFLYYIDSTNTQNQGTVAVLNQTGTIFWQLGCREAGSDTYLSGYGPYPALGETQWTHIEYGPTRWVEIRYQVNSSGITAFYDNEWVYTNDTTFISNKFGIIDLNNEDTTFSQTYDLIYIYRDYGGDNPTITSTGVEDNLNPPDISGLNCSNGTAWKTSFDWGEVISACQVITTDAEGDSLYINFSMYNGTTAQFENLKNDTNSSGGLFRYDFDDVTVNIFADWNVTALAFDGTATNQTNISWAVTNTAPNTPSPIAEYEDQYVFNMTTDVNVSAIYSDAQGQSGECHINFSKDEVIQFSVNISVNDGEYCSFVVDANNFSEPCEDWTANFTFYDGSLFSDYNYTSWTTQLWQETAGGGGDPLCVQYLQVDSFTGLEIEYNLTVQCVNSKADANYSTVTITPYTDFGGAETIEVLANSTNQVSFYNTSSRGTSDGGAYTIDGAVVTENITLTTNAIKHFIPIDPPYAFTKDGIIDCDQGMYVNKDITLATPITFRGAGEFLISAVLRVTGLNKPDTDCVIAIDGSGRLEVNL